MMNGWVRGRVGDGVEKGVRGDMKVDDQDANRRLGGTSGGLYLYTQTASTHLYIEIQACHRAQTEIWLIPKLLCRLYEMGDQYLKHLAADHLTTLYLS